MVRNKNKRYNKRSIEAQANKMIDQYFHPYFRKNKSFIIADAALHFIVEQNPRKSIRKFVRYSLFKLIE